MIQKTMILILLLTILTPFAVSGEEQEIRMRVIGNSDTAEDQSVKEALYQSVQPELIQLLGNQPLTRQELADQLTVHLDQIRQIVEKAAGVIAPDQKISTAFEPHTFPDGQTFLTLVIKVGEGAGENWWCTFFPEMCGTVTLDEDKNTECENDLSPEKKVSKTEMKVESFIVNWISDKWNRFNEKRG
ncbi:stage II sporulation protein R [Jeotgalibacillus haloalkalitolerans]|uniref:Stage II sporulation protein R n=1 Tax=Jeotgalibacillus haloalkalitolerans TaxID=3104292 RepID=A0ABU5KKE6_9BACL|nr:stage II sporulation protein R [Jeotgalibacillus sp. HH7-29]MDZ5711226.1 stage II sporulation protein R [Jeotgalibacillus sp. HH7-29]